MANKRSLISLANTNKLKPSAGGSCMTKKAGAFLQVLTFNPLPCTSNQNSGVIGLDINADHLALVETNRSGNPLSKKVIPFNLYGKSSNQTRALIGDAAASAIDYAEKSRKPLIFEDLDFQKKKTELREKNQSFPRTDALLLCLSVHDHPSQITSS